jgi:hypothetical protein
LHMLDDNGLRAGTRKVLNQDMAFAVLATS